MTQKHASYPQLINQNHNFFTGLLEIIIFFDSNPVFHMQNFNVQFAFSPENDPKT